ncbi:MAG: hypothetical protein ABIR32_08600 [Ilumatobacteraceae bacterium]
MNELPDGRSDVLPPAESLPSRRMLLRIAGAGAVGLAAGAAGTIGGARPVAAVAGDPMRVGFVHTSFNQTRISPGATSPPSIGAVVNDGAAMLLIDATNTSGFAIDARGGFNAIRAKGATIGVASFGEKYSFAALASDTAAIAFGETATDGDKKLAPINRVDLHARGELDNDGQGNLWWCSTAGVPGQWRKLAGPESAGAFHPVTPTRVYDSRLELPSPGRLRAGEARQIRVADGRDLSTGGANLSDLVPEGATAATGNLTIAETSGGGFLTLNEGGNNAVTSSAINWFESGQVISNSFVVKLDGGRSVAVVAGGGSTHFIIDITGYYL